MKSICLQTTKSIVFFRISKLKRFKGDIPATVVLPDMVVDNQLPAILTTMLGSWTVLKNNVPHVELLIQWEGVSPKETLWESLEEMAAVFPSLDLVDKVSLNGYGDDTFSFQLEMVVYDLQKLEEATEVKQVVAGRRGEEEGSDWCMVGASENDKAA